MLIMSLCVCGWGTFQHATVNYGIMNLGQSRLCGCFNLFGASPFSSRGMHL